MNDNPSFDQQVGRIIERVSAQQYQLNSIRDSIKELNDAVARLGLLQREQNGNVSRIIEKQVFHDKWHGEQDTNIGYRLGVLEQDKHDAVVAKGVWLSQWKALSASAALGATLASLIAVVFHLLGG